MIITMSASSNFSEDFANNVEIAANMVDAPHRTFGNLFAVGGHVVMILKKKTLAAAVIH